jgi:polygalacturonase
MEQKMISLTRRSFTGLLAASPQAVVIRDFGAAGNGRELDTVAIQTAIDACAKSGGGTVCFPPGTYRSGTLMLRSRVALYLSEGSCLQGSTELADYPVTVSGIRTYTDNYTDKSLIYAENLESVSILGSGKIDGSGAAFLGEYKKRPYLMRFVNCRNVDVRDVTLKDSPMWVQHYLACEDVRISGIRVRSRVNGNNDGIDIDSCQRVRISDCDISSGDDGICLKSTYGQPCRDVVVSNCIVSSDSNGIKLGTETNGGFENIAVTNCTVYDTRLSGVALEIVDGGTLDGVVVSNIAMRNTDAAVFVRLGDRGRPFRTNGPRPGVGKLRHVVVQGIQATGVGKTGCVVSGLPGHPVEGLTLRDINVVSAGGGNAADAMRVVPEAADQYPEYSMFGVLPAHGLYARHVRGLVLENVRCTTVLPDARPGVVRDDVE